MKHDVTDGTVTRTGCQYTPAALPRSDVLHRFIFASGHHDSVLGLSRGSSADDSIQPSIIDACNLSTVKFIREHTGMVVGRCRISTVRRCPLGYLSRTLYRPASVMISGTGGTFVVE